MSQNSAQRRCIQFIEDDEQWSLYGCWNLYSGGKTNPGRLIVNFSTRRGKKGNENGRESTKSGIDMQNIKQNATDKIDKSEKRRRLQKSGNNEER